MAVALATLAACRQNASVATLQIDFDWSRANECKAHSPEIKVNGLPPEAQFLRVRLIDLYQPGADHGGWGNKIAVSDGGVIPEGGLAHFRGPCPPKYYGPSKYEFTVEALDQKDVRVGLGKQAKECCSDW